jgi:hypothetical protein
MKMNLTNLADWIHEHWYAAHRCAVKVGPYHVLFGNDGFGCPMVSAELSYAYRWLHDRKFRVLGFATDSEFLTWAMVIRAGRGNSEEKLTKMLFEAWEAAYKMSRTKDEGIATYTQVQTAIAFETVAEKPLPKSLADWLKKAPFRRRSVAATV